MKESSLGDFSRVLSFTQCEQKRNFVVIRKESREGHPLRRLLLRPHQEKMSRLDGWCNMSYEITQLAEEHKNVKELIDRFNL